LRENRIPSAFPYFDDSAIERITEDIKSTLRSGVFIDGVHGQDFEKKFAEYIGVKQAIAVDSCSSALEIALRYFKVKDREVIVPTNTFVASPNSVLFAGGKPVFVDIKENTLCIDIEDVKNKLSSNTVGVMVVHIAGLICPEIKQLVDFCEENNLFLLEDAAHAHGAMIDGKKAGALADVGCFSFYPTKVMTCGKGGMITTDNPKVAELAKCLRSYGLDSQRLMKKLGHSWWLSEIHAIIGKHQLERLEEFVRKRNEIAKEYVTALRDTDGIYLLEKPGNIRHSYYKFPVRLDEKLDREEITRILKEEYNIETGTIYYPPCHLHPYYKDVLGTQTGDLPVAEKVLNKILCLPVFVGMNEEDTNEVCEALESVIARFNKK